MYVINKLWFLSVCVMEVRCSLGRTTLVMYVSFIPIVSPVVMHHAIAQGCQCMSFTQMSEEGLWRQ